jgi:uncharacterized membrane protein
MGTCKDETNNWAIVLVGIIITALIIIGLFGVNKDLFIPVAEDILTAILTLTVTFLNLLGGMLILFGSILVAARYVLRKLKTPCKPFGAAPRVTFLTLGLEIFIGAEIINTATTRTMDDFLLLSLTIGTRGLIGLILYLEKRWGSMEEATSNGNNKKLTEKTK